MRDNLVISRNGMKQQAYQHRSERGFEEGDWVFLRLQPYKHMSLKQLNTDNKISPKYYGHYKVLQKIGFMAYKLEFFAFWWVHPVFHVSCLKKEIVYKIPIQTILSKLDEGERFILEPKKIFETKTKQLRTQVITEYLIKWKNLPIEYLTWEDESFIQKHPQLTKRWGQPLLEGEGHVKP